MTAKVVTLTKEEFNALPVSVQANLRTQWKEFSAIDVLSEMNATGRTVTKTISDKQSTLSARLKAISTKEELPTQEEWDEKSRIEAERSLLSKDKTKVLNENKVGRSHKSIYTTIIEMNAEERRDFISKTVGPIKAKHVTPDELVKVVLYRAEKAVEEENAKAKEAKTEPKTPEPTPVVA